MTFFKPALVSRDGKFVNNPVEGDEYIDNSYLAIDPIGINRLVVTTRGELLVDVSDLQQQITELGSMIVIRGLGDTLPYPASFPSNSGFILKNDAEHGNATSLYIIIPGDNPPLTNTWEYVGPFEADMSNYVTIEDLQDAIDAIIAGLPSFPLAVSQGGTGRTSMPLVQVNLTSNASVPVIPPTGNSAPGVTGVLSVANGGTGGNTPELARAGIDAAWANAVLNDNMGTSVIPTAGVAIPLTTVLQIYRDNIKYLLGLFPVSVANGGTGQTNLAAFIASLYLTLSDNAASEILPPAGSSTQLQAILQRVRDNLKALFAFKGVVETFMTNTNSSLTSIRNDITTLTNALNAISGIMFYTQAQYDALGSGKLTDLQVRGIYASDGSGNHLSKLIKTGVTYDFGGVYAPTANELMRRNASGRVQVENPVELKDAVNLAYIKTLFAPQLLTASRNWYVNGATGNDSNDGSSPELAFKTVQYGLSYIANGFHLGNYNAYLNVASGTYPEFVTCPSYNRSTGSLVVRRYASTTDPVWLYRVQNSGSETVSFQDISIKFPGNAGGGVTYYGWYSTRGDLSITNTTVDLSTPRDGTFTGGIYGTCASGGSVTIAGTINMFSGASTVGSFLYAPGNVINIMNDIVFNGTVSSGTFVATNGGHGQFYTHSNGGVNPVMSGTVTGYRHRITTNATFSSNGVGVEAFPGTIPGTTSTGGQFI